MAFVKTFTASAIILVITSACSDGSGLLENILTNPENAPPASLGAANPDLGAAVESENGLISPIESQAIDGYIVGGTVFCDDVISGVTQTAGRLTCPVGTRVIKVRGGVDVGFNQSATTGDTLFVGELSAPGSLPYVTPLSSIAVEMSSNDNGFDETQWLENVSKLSRTLEVPTLDLTVNAATNLELVRLNAQINQVVTTFSQNHDDYTLVMKALANTLSQNADEGAFSDLDDGVVDTMLAVNEQLVDNNPELSLSAEEITNSIMTVQQTNSAIAVVESPDSVSNVATSSLVDQASITIDRTNASIGIRANHYYYYPSATNISLDDFEYPVLSSGRYNTVINSRLRGISYENRVLQFNESFENASVSMAFEIKALNEDDQRSLSFATDDVTLTATQNDASSMVLTMPVDAIFNVHGTRKNGTVTTTEILVEEADTFSSVGSQLNVTFGKINDRLIELGYTDILATSGNYQMTMVISGLHINERSGSQVQPATYYTIGSGATQLTGAGFQGYITYER